MNRELTKWPVLLVDGAPVSPEQADQVIIRTTWLRGLDCNDKQWDKTVRRAFGVRLPRLGHRWDLPEDRMTKQRAYWEAEDKQWGAAEDRLGVLPLNFLTNDRIASTYMDGPYGWCDWSGQVRSYGMPLLFKWPTVEDVTQEWQMIANAFPFLSLTAQLVRDGYAGDYGKDPYEPLVTWTVGRGGVELHHEPGPLIIEPRESDPDLWPPRIMRPRGDHGVSARRLRSAVRRCGPKVKGTRHC